MCVKMWIRVNREGLVFCDCCMGKRRWENTAFGGLSCLFRSLFEVDGGILLAKVWQWLSIPVFRKRRVKYKEYIRGDIMDKDSTGTRHIYTKSSHPYQHKFTEQAPLILRRREMLSATEAASLEHRFHSQPSTSSTSLSRYPPEPISCPWPKPLRVSPLAPT